MKLFTAEQIRRWDSATILEQGIQSIDLMERAAWACAEKILILNRGKNPVHIFCGQGNNGGDGLAITRLLHEKDIQVHAYVLVQTPTGSPDFNTNLERLSDLNIPVTYIRNTDGFPQVSDHVLVIDALFGTGLNKPLDGLAASLAQYLNELTATRISIDIPSGLFADHGSQGCTVFHAHHTLSFQSYKRCFLFAASESFTGKLHIIDIGLSRQFHEHEPCTWEMIEENTVRSMIKPKRAFAHKGDFGHAAIAAGSRGMMGAAVMAAGACLQSGAGKLTCYVPAAGYEIMQTARPEAMCIITGENQIGQLEHPEKFDALGIGPGLGQFDALADILRQLFENPPPRLIMDADALNGMGISKSLWKKIPAGTLITPHPGEFARLTGQSSDDWEQLTHAIELSAQHDIYIILKGHYSRIICPDGMVYFNPTGNAGMAKGGSGDVLTGLLTGLLAQGYQTKEAAILGTYLHGLAGDLAASTKTETAMSAMDILDQIHHAWAILQSG